jgi:hypothetical protein
LSPGLARRQAVKVRGLVEWLRRVHGIDVGERGLPLLADRTEPYDPKVMLESGLPTTEPH